MEARFEKSEDVVIVHLKGRIRYESVDPFRVACMNYLKNEKVIFDLKDLNFVGSQGLGSFVQTMEELASQNERQLKFCSVSSEFQKIFQNSKVSDIQILDDAPQAQLAFRRSHPMPEFEERPEFPAIKVEC